jgi:hypothetical protein
MRAPASRPLARQVDSFRRLRWGVWMPTNLPEPPKREPQASEETFLKALIVLISVAMVVACAIIIWSLWFASG